MSSILASTDNLIQEIERRLPERIIQGKNTDALAVTVAGAALAYIVGKYIIYQGYFHPLCKIPGPKTKNILTGHVKLVFLTGEAGSVFKQWTNQYGSIAMFRGLFNTPMLMISDPQVLKQILTTQQYDFEKTPEGSVFIKRVLGEGLLVAEGNLHRQQRKILNPAFTVAATRDLVPLMAVPAVQLAEKWQKEIEHKGENSSTPVEIQVSYGLNLATLDIIGLAGFGQEFHALAYDGTDKINKLSSAYMTIFGSNEGNRSMLRFLSSFFPILGKIPTRDNIEYQRALKWINEESRKVVEHGIQQSKVEKRNNLLALMIDTESEDGKKMSIKELQNQCLTFLAAGHETASVTVSWCLWLLAQHQDIQDALREEVKPVVEKLNAAHDIFRKDPFANPTGSGVPTYDELNELPLLNNVCKETLRLIPAVPNTSRISVKDTVMNGYFVPKGTRVFLAPIALHHSKAVWGPDAEEFRPSRWNEEPASKATPYEYMPFLAGGRQCIGYRFAQIEMKIILAILISRFQYFEVPGFEPEKKQIITLRPVPYMTLLVKPLQQ